LIFGLFVSCLGKVSPGQGIPDAYVIETDRYATNLETVFDTSKAILPLVTKKSTPGFCYGDDVPFAQNDYSHYGVSGGAAVKHVGENIAAFVFGGNKIVF